MKKYDYLIIGAGPAGLQMSYFLEQSKSNYIVIEKTGKVASFFRILPRRRELISFNKVYSIFDDPEILLRWDWNSLLTDDYSFPFRKFSKRFYPRADELVNYLESFAQTYNLNIKYNTTIIKVKRISNKSFEIYDSQGEIYQCRTLIVATGFCPFHVRVEKGSEIYDRYTEALCQEMELVANLPYVSEMSFNAVYFGGGSPSIFSVKNLRQIFAKLVKNFKIAAGLDSLFLTSLFFDLFLLDSFSNITILFPFCEYSLPYYLGSYVKRVN